MATVDVVTVRRSVVYFAVTLLFVTVSCVSVTRDPPYETRYFHQYLDHFNFASRGAGTFKERVLVSDAFWRSGGPIFFYTGNEGPITRLWNEIGFMKDLAEQFEALIVFAEHRYYGESLPFGENTISQENMGLLTVEQALADYAVLITNLTVSYCQDPDVCPVIAFGGSYGGVLSTFLRLKYPNLVAGALASSANVYMSAGLTPGNQLFQDVTEDFRRYNPRCPDRVREGFAEMERLAGQGEQGLHEISTRMKLCSSLQDHADLVNMYRWVREAFTVLAMEDLPYAISNGPFLPAYPVNASCNLLLKATDGIEEILQAVGMLYNFTSNLSCFDLHEDFVPCADPTGCSLMPGAKAWDYQTCTEISLLESTDNVTDMFPPDAFTEETRAAHCRERWGVTPRPGWLATQFWGKDLKASSNIIFSNGDLDPWRRGGVLQNVSSSIVALEIQGGAHIMDLRAPNATDPLSVIRVRQQEAHLIGQWISEATNQKEASGNG
ncbi:PREDICTED: dipeptidyl peptidase 2-like [Branchiostoma belcheri]|uniref:Dipeptidyl peptidase 2-like n=1 Tax=Branchiostoma belcheri TaxID=7741 RepID=A0A6P4YYS8_BRABE|nr:PREDICTED: dipeptidyl peptidase 2-like [Branchiostoma belcheri]